MKITENEQFYQAGLRANCIKYSYDATTSQLVGSRTGVKYWTACQPSWGHWFKSGGNNFIFFLLRLAMTASRFEHDVLVTDYGLAPHPRGPVGS